MQELEQLFQYEKSAIDDNKKKIDFLLQKIKEKDNSSKTPKKRKLKIGKVISLPFFPELTPEHIELADILREKEFLLPLGSHLFNPLRQKELQEIFIN